MDNLIGRRYVAVVLAVLLTPGFTFAESDPTDQVERSMRFVDKVSEATGLYNEGKVEQALAIFQELDRNDRDLDADGFVGLSLGDCLAELKRTDEARQAYQAVLQLHPDLEPKISERLIKLDLAGDVTEGMLDRLRNQTRGKPEATNFVMLGFGLQKRAYELLGEAHAAFKLAKEQNPLLGACPGKQDPLEELLEDLRELIEQTEVQWSPRPAAAMEKSPGTAIWFKKLEGEWDVRTKPSAATTKMQLKADSKGEWQLLVGGKAIPLTEEQRKQICHRQMQIMNILSEVVGKNK